MAQDSKEEVVEYLCFNKYVGNIFNAVLCSHIPMYGFTQSVLTLSSSRVILFDGHMMK